MQDDVDGEWGDGDDTQQYISEEPTRVSALPTRVRYRTFAPALEGESIRIGRTQRDFFVHKRRRYEDCGCDGANRPYTRPLLRLLRDSFGLASRRMDTLVWLTTQTRSASDIMARFALDRKLGATPSQACLNRALHHLGRLGEVDLILDMVEDAVTDSGRLALSTVLAVIRGLHSQPVHAARLALSLQCTLPSNAAVPLEVWSGLGSALARYAQRLPKPLEEHFMELLDATMGVVRSQSETLSEALLADYGSCLLASKRPLAFALRLVGEELLTGRNRKDTGVGQDGEDEEADTALPLGAFLTDLLVALCEEVSLPPAVPASPADTRDRRRKGLGHEVAETEDDTTAAPNRGGWGAGSFSVEEMTRIGVSSVAELITFCGDVVKYAYARKIHLAPKAFDSVLKLCDDAHEYYRLCILFLSMCVLSVPTLRSTLRAVEVLNTVPTMQSRLTELLGRTPQATIVWCLKRFGSIVLLPTPHSAKAEEALEAFCIAVGALLSSAPVSSAPGRTAYPVRREDERGAAAAAPGATLSATGVSQIHEVATLLLRECPSSRYAAAMIAHFVTQERRLRSAATRSTRELIQALEALNTIALECFMAEGGVTAAEANPSDKRHCSFEDAVRHDGGSYIDGAIRLVLSSAQMYCNVLDVSAVNALAAQPAAEAAFAKMMAGYMSKAGALVVVPMELLTATFDVTEGACTLVRRWRHTHADWFAVLPLSLSLQLDGATDIAVAVDFFLRVRRAGHQKVALVTSSRDNEAAAKSSNALPVIYLPDLLQRLGVPVSK